MRLGSTIYHCRQLIDTDGFISYTAPKAYITKFFYLTVMPASGNMETEEYGEQISHKWTILANANIFESVFKEGDVLYLEGQKPEENGDYGSGANALITSVRSQNKMIRIIAEKRDLQGKGLIVE